MNIDEIKEVISNHSKWLEGRKGGKLADLQGADLHGADLHGADLRGADLRGADLHGADLHGTNFNGADLTGANLHGADLHGTNFNEADLTGANLHGADLNEADLRRAHLRWADLSGTKGLLSASDWIKDNFKYNNDGVIVYKVFGLYHSVPSYWTIVPGAIIKEAVNSERTIVCGCGVNFGTLEWCQKNDRGLPIWKCLIKWIDLADVVVPYNTDGKARCQRLTLLETISK